MEPDRAHAISTLQTLLFLSKREEKRLRAILSDAPEFMIKMQTRTDLEKVLWKTKAQSEELAKLHAEP